MNWPYIHTLINHFPIILSVVGTAVLLLALITRRRGVWLYAVATLTMAGVSAYPAFYTGGAASHALRGTWYIVPAMVKEHDGAATFALLSLLITGIVSAVAWWRMLKGFTEVTPANWLKVVLVLLALWNVSVVVRTAYLGGQIVHDSPKLASPPAPTG